MSARDAPRAERPGSADGPARSGDPARSDRLSRADDPAGSDGLSRADRLASMVAERGLEAVLVRSPVNLRYLTGFTGTNGVCIVGPDVRHFLTDFRYVDQAAAEVAAFDRAQGGRDLLGDAAERLSGRVGFEDDHLTVRAHERLAEMVGDRAELVPAGGMVEELRAVKDAGELEVIRAAAALADGVYEYLVERGVAGRTEREVAIDLEREMRDRGAEGPSFPSIVASGPHGALPHARPRPEPIARDTLLIVDLGCELEGYCSDCTRTFATGSLPGEATRVYDLVLTAQQQALEAVQAGAGHRAVDAVGREIIAAAGHGERFGHGLGHGVGMEVHEAPRLSPSADEDGTLAAGNVVTVEPGVYLSDAFGVRIEDLVAVTEDGCEVLSRFPKSLVTLDA